jgi:phage portal protein BeeE
VASLISRLTDAVRGVDRLLLPEPSTALAVVEPQEVQAKAATGPGVIMMEHGAPLHSWANSVHKRMYEMQSLFRANIWVNAAESAVAGRFARVGYHLELDDGETLDRGMSPVGDALLDLIDWPNQDQGRAKTRRALWKLTRRHAGLCGNALWFLDQAELLGGTPLSILYVNPVRLTPAEDDSGNLIGWVVDHPENQVTGRRDFAGLPLQLSEVIHFTLDDPDFGHFGIGKVEAAMSKIELSRLADHHTAGVLATGGRLAGILSPKERDAVNETEWDAVVRSWRTIAADPDSAKRLHIVKGAVEFNRTSATPSELELPSIMEGARDDILAAWGVPPSQIGIMKARGLNSGATIEFEEAALWQGGIEDWATGFAEMVQHSLVDKFADLGLKARLVLEMPTFDDDAPRYENAQKARYVPMSVNQRLEILGKDPLDEDTYGKLGSTILIDKSMVTLDTVISPPTPAPNPFQPDEPEREDDGTDTDDAATAMGKADLREPLMGLRSRVETTFTPALRKTVDDFLGRQRTMIAERVRTHHEAIIRNPRDATVWWVGDPNRALALAIDAPLEELASMVSAQINATLKRDVQGKATLLETVLAVLRASVGQRITGINQTTRNEVGKAIETGVAEGLTASELASRIEDASTFNAARAEMIARTETALAYNDAALGTYRELQVERVQVIDGDGDAECSHVNGATWSLDEANANPIGHPHCVRDFIPLLN